MLETTPNLKNKKNHLKVRGYDRIQMKTTVAEKIKLFDYEKENVSAHTLADKFAIGRI